MNDKILFQRHSLVFSVGRQRIGYNLTVTNFHLCKMSLNRTDFIIVSIFKELRFFFETRCNVTLL